MPGNLRGPLWLAFLCLLLLLCTEIVAPGRVMEGFQTITPSGTQDLGPSNSIFAQAFKRRSDVGPMSEASAGGKDGQGVNNAIKTGNAQYTVDKRYFADYTDVQGIGIPNDYCRVVFPSGSEEKESFFACALAGTEGLSTVDYRTRAVKDGFVLSRDDYMKIITPNGRNAYCRIIKNGAEFMPMCAVPGLNDFGSQDVLDTEPPDNIKTLVDFYRDCRMWLRFYDDMIDYTKRGTILQVAGGAAVTEFPPRPVITRALHFNGVDQFVRLGDSRDLSLGNVGSLRSVRAFSVWVKFDTFTNNAHIFDFGDGAGKNNVFLGILGRGDPDSATNSLRPGTACEESTVPGPGSGAQFCPELRAEDLYRISAANVDEFVCTGPEIYADPSKAQPLQTRKQTKNDPNAKYSRATLLYEVWDSKLRAMQIKINQAIPVGQWTHIVITAMNMDAMRPNIAVYINGNYTYTKNNGCLPQAAVTQKNYFGKSNWADNSSGYELRDELLSGSIFDFRMYTSALSETKIKRILQWGMEHLGLSVTQTAADVAGSGPPASDTAAHRSNKTTYRDVPGNI
jgi:hypothetical protein